MAEERNNPAPVDLWLETDGSLFLEWNDGHQSRVSGARLRQACPCAICRETRERSAHAGAGLVSAPPNTTIRTLERVGRYGVSLTWGDGHSTGIYPWPLLRELCDCFQCRMERREES